MQIGALADQSGVSAKTLRFYEARGLLPVPHRAANGYRFYDESIVARVRFIVGCRALGLSLPEIAAILALRDHAIAPCSQLLATLDTHATLIDQQIAALTTLRDQLSQLRATGQRLPQDDVTGVGCICALIRDRAMTPVE